MFTRHLLYESTHSGAQQLASTEPHVGGEHKYNGVLLAALRGLFVALPSPPQCHATIGTVSQTLAWVDHCPCQPSVDITPLCDVDSRGCLLEGYSWLSYPVFISVLSVQHYIVICGLSGCTIFFTLSHKWHNFQKINY